MEERYISQDTSAKVQACEGPASDAVGLVLSGQEGVSMEDICDYDPADNARKCYDVAIREIRLNKIRRGLAHPRPHVEWEMDAWRQGVLARGLIVCAVAASFVAVAAIAMISHGEVQEGKIKSASVTGDK